MPAAECRLVFLFSALTKVEGMPMVKCLLTLVLASLILLPVTLIQLSGEEHLRNWGLQARTLCSTLRCWGRGQEGDGDHSASSACLVKGLVATGLLRVH